MTLASQSVTHATVALAGITQTNPTETGFVFDNVLPGDYTVSLYAEPPGTSPSHCLR